MLEAVSAEQEAEAAAAVDAAAAAEAAEALAAAKEAAARALSEQAAHEAAEAELAAKAAAEALASSEASAAAAKAIAAAETAAKAARTAAAVVTASYASVDEMLSLADLEEAPVCGDGNCGYYACLASGSESVLSHCLRSAPVLAPSREDYEAQQSLRERCVAWLLAPEQAALLRTEKYDAAAVEKQRKGKRQRGGPMGVYANGAALRAMAAVEKVHLVVISTFTGPSGGKGFKGHGRVVKGRPFDRVVVYPPNDGKPLRRFKSWANDVVPVLLRRATGVELPV